MNYSFQAKKVRFETVDGLEAANTELRGKLFDISGKRGIYPQVLNSQVPTIFLNIFVQFFPPGLYPARWSILLRRRL